MPAPSPQLPQARAAAATATLSAAASALIVVDVQSKLAPVIADGAAAIERIGLALEAAEALGVPVLASEQYPRGLGTTVAELKARLPADARIAKTHFSCLREADFAQRWQALGRCQALVCGMETHVCVMQTCLDLLRAGVETFVLVDGVGSRRTSDRAVALARLAAAGAVPLPTESAIFEWMGDCGHPAFKSLIARIRDSGG